MSEPIPVAYSPQKIDGNRDVAYLAVKHGKVEFEEPVDSTCWDNPSGMREYTQPSRCKPFTVRWDGGHDLQPLDWAIVDGIRFVVLHKTCQFLRRDCFGSLITTFDFTVQPIIETKFTP